MSDESESLEEQFPLWLAACDEALAAGAEPATLPPLGVPGELRPRLEREVAWCQLVRQLWPHVEADDIPTTLPEPQAVGETVLLPLARLGRFELRRELGRGAFGVVFLAHDPHLGRAVALKVPRAEVLVTPELRARFQHEARAAAVLDHPNIVPVYDAGEEASVCYIAQAYCPGTTLAAWLKQQSEPVSVRLAARLTAKLAAAVQHAHERGVLHRDLKPGNVMLEAPAGESPPAAGPAGDRLPFVPRITDFGLAKLAEGVDGVSQGYQTQSGAVVGTPQYMAPEQAEGRSKGVGPAADVYALGTILYELLTGRPPFVGETPLATLQLVRSQEPLSPARLRPGLPRDLETICLHCLHKEPGKRYPSARNLAEDLERFLEGVPIQARPIPAWERGLKWVRRRPAAAALVAVSVTAVLVVAALIAFSNARLVEQRNVAETKRTEAETNAEEARAQRRRALTHLRNAISAIDQMLVAADRLAPAPYTLTVRRELTEDALRFLQELAREEDNDPEIRYEVGRGLRRLGQMYGALGQREQAAQKCRQAVAMFEQLTAEEPGKPACWRELAASCNNLSLALGPQEREESERLLRRALALQDRLAADHPDTPGYRLDASVTRGDLANVLFVSQRHQEADQAVQEAIDGLEKLVASTPSSRDYRFHLANVLNNQAASLGWRGRSREIEPVLRRAIETLEPLTEGPSADPGSRSRLVLACRNLGNLLHEHRRPQDAETVLRRAATLGRRLLSDFPEVPAYHAGLGATLALLAFVVWDRRDLVEAGQLLEEAIRIQRAALERASDDPATVKSLGINLFELAELRLQQEHYREAVQVAEELRAHRQSTGHGDYEAARVLSRCISLAEKDARLSAAQRQELTSDYARRAVEYLRLAIQKGRKDAATWSTEGAFAPLRSRSDFQQLTDTTRKP